MYGDGDVIRRRAGQLREQALDIRALADSLVGRSDAAVWHGRAAESMRTRIRERATHLRETAAAHEDAAEALLRHAESADDARDEIADRTRRAELLVTAARGRQVEGAADPVDRVLLGFTPPPAGHRDWLTVELPGL